MRAAPTNSISGSSSVAAPVSGCAAMPTVSVNGVMALSGMASGPPLMAPGSTSPPLRRGRVLLCGPVEQRTYLVVGRRCKVLVPEADGVERFRRDGAHDLIHLRAQLVARLRCRDRHGDDDAGGLLLAQGGDG